MQYTQEMILRSDSGYCMPYEEKGRDVQMSLGYGKQKHPHTGEPFFIMVWISKPTIIFFQQLQQGRSQDLGMMPYMVSIG